MYKNKKKGTMRGFVKRKSRRREQTQMRRQLAANSMYSCIVDWNIILHAVRLQRKRTTGSKGSVYKKQRKGKDRKLIQRW
jgi:hypothetical protein